jgi:transcriptional regulator with XRE-family HTH domain
VASPLPSRAEEPGRTGRNALSVRRASPTSCLPGSRCAAANDRRPLTAPFGHLASHSAAGGHSSGRPVALPRPRDCRPGVPWRSLPHMHQPPNDLCEFFERRGGMRNGDRRFSLRQVAQRIHVQPAYLSQVERGNVAPPSEATIRRLAKDLGEDPNVLLALAGKVSDDLQEVIRRRPAVYAELLRSLRTAPFFGRERSFTRGIRERGRPILTTPGRSRAPHLIVPGSRRRRPGRGQPRPGRYDTGYFFP